MISRLLIMCAVAAAVGLISPAAEAATLCANDRVFAKSPVGPTPWINKGGARKAARAAWELYVNVNKKSPRWRSGRSQPREERPATGSQTASADTIGAVWFRQSPVRTSQHAIRALLPDIPATSPGAGIRKPHALGLMLQTAQAVRAQAIESQQKTFSRNCAAAPKHR